MLDGKDSGYPKATRFSSAYTPHWDQLWKDYPHALIRPPVTTSAFLPQRHDNSEVGHLNLGAG